MQILGNKRNLLVITLVLLLSLVMIYVNFIQPEREKAAQKKSELAAKTEQLKALEQRIGQTQDIAQNSMLQLQQTRARIPERPYEEQLLRELRMLEVASGLQMSAYQLEIGKSSLANETTGKQANGNEAANQAEGQLAPQLAALVVPIKLTVAVTGDYDKIYRLLSETETSSRLLQVNQLSFNTQSLPAVQIRVPKRNISAQLSMTAYFAPGLQQVFHTPLPVDYAPPTARKTPIY